MQRVVAGSLRGRRLLALPRSITGVRPSSSRVRSAIFDRLQAEVVGARVLDLFAGSGALAIEALSRGASHATLVERHRALRPFLVRQLAALGLTDHATIVSADARRYLGEQARAGADAARGRFDLVLVDPPYDTLDLYAAALDGLVTSDMLRDEAVIVIEHQIRRGRRPAVALPISMSTEAIRDHGHTALEFLRYSRPRATP